MSVQVHESALAGRSPGDIALPDTHTSALSACLNIYALPKIEVALQVAERQLAHDREYLLGPELALADFYLLPCTYSFSFAPEAKTMYPKFSAFCRWRERMEGLPAVKKLRASLPPRIPIEHAREWAVSHRPKY